jgi:ubiquinone/menaquinone biosynthesis C-methylase UbiE
MMRHVPRLDDSEYVVAEYADDAGLAGLAPTTVLEVGCGQGAFAHALVGMGLAVIASDQSARMVALTAVRGVRADQADVRHLPYDDGAFDLVAANYMLYHVSDLARALTEIVRVLRPGGTLVAVTTSTRKLQEMWDLVGLERGGAAEEGFNTENGTGLLVPYFNAVERVDVDERFRVTADGFKTGPLVTL